MEILDNMTQVYTARLTNESFVQVLEDHITFITERATRTETINDNVATRWAGDFSGLLSSLGIKADFHHITARINGLTSVNDDFSEMNIILIPEESTIEGIINRYRQP